MNCKDSDKYMRYYSNSEFILERDAHLVLSLEPDADETAELDTSGVVRLFRNSHDYAESDEENYVSDSAERDGENFDDCAALDDAPTGDLGELFWEPTEKTWKVDWYGC